MKMNDRFPIAIFLLSCFLLVTACGCKEESPQVLADEPQTTSQPADSAPASHPSTAPADSQPVAQAPPFHPLEHAQLGQWARYRAMEKMEIVYRIKAVRGREVEVQIEAYRDGSAMGIPTRRTEPRDRDPLAARGALTNAQRSCRPDTITLAGKKWDALCYEDRWSDEGIAYHRRTWVSAEVPVYGIILIEKTGNGIPESRIELMAWK